MEIHANVRAATPSRESSGLTLPPFVANCLRLVWQYG